ncbi:MAG: hypothetical protein K0S63_1226, partial [Gammaproteobacteria bacterium]|nr:hypothetical protein [Gammaproteobacteria bacterium]
MILIIFLIDERKIDPHSVQKEMVLKEWRLHA